MLDSRYFSFSEVDGIRGSGGVALAIGGNTCCRRKWLRTLVNFSVPFLNLIVAFFLVRISLQHKSSKIDELGAIHVAG